MTAGLGIFVSPVFEALDPDALAKNYDGTARVACSAAALTQLVSQINVLAARCPRVVFSHVAPTPSAGGTTFLWQWIVPDFVVNGTEREFRALSTAREADTSTNGYWARAYVDTGAFVEDTTCAGPEHAGQAPTWGGSFREWVEERATFTRTATNMAPEDDLVQEGVVCIEDQKVAALIVQDMPLSSLDVEDHEYVATSPNPGDPVLGGHVLEALRSVLHSVRSKNLPVIISWCATGYDTGFAVTASADEANERGIYITSTSYLNILAPALSAANSWATRTAGTPGFMAHVYACGRGDPSTADGSRLRVECYVLAEATTEDGTVRFEGPDTWASNNTEITATVAGGLDWYGSDANGIYLDTSVSNSDDTTARAKIDVCAKAGTGGGLKIYGLFAHAVFEEPPPI